MVISGWAVVASVGLYTAIMVGAPRYPSGLLVEDRKTPDWVAIKFSSLWNGKPHAPSRVYRGGCATIAGAMGWMLGDGFIALGFSVLLGSVTYVLVGRTESKQAAHKKKALLEQADGALDLIAAALQAGAPLRVAVRSVAAVVPEPTASFLNGIDAQTMIGRSDAEAWESVRDDPVWGRVARDLARSVDSGSGIAELLRVHAEDLRQSIGAERERRARTVGVRAVLPLMTCFLPAFILVGVVPIIAGTIGTLIS